ncbi:Glyoxalase/Bleomycin resistance protein/Dioxygenase superfamily protein [Sphingomonas guangdongensis]|uniref:Glyoxalase/Bleomycin resistance protein/Dioxygenase superfamily protein n=1 Tax=Sphingomonas guangdongensis TaxID=1141890 RepID=A0A285QGL2_9SPHN|nr:VOC family protein [Sphingomonas guangdongensis]SOB80986.1 Glyoxalase/Bleomycin resistance protein/Dioxygenase superfamily protein [Sphingomonas guangdongensis]
MPLPVVLALLAAVPAQAVPPPPPPARADHLSLSVADVDASTAWYQRIFGLAELPAPVKGPRWLDLGGGVALHLSPGRTAPVSPDRRNHLALRVSDFAAFVQRLEREGVAFTDFEGRPATVQRV